MAGGLDAPVELLSCERVCKSSPLPAHAFQEDDQVKDNGGSLAKAGTKGGQAKKGKAGKCHMLRTFIAAQLIAVFQPARTLKSVQKPHML